MARKRPNKPAKKPKPSSVFTPYFLSLDAKSAYDVAAALRGPDSYDDALLTLKHIVTTRLRAIVFARPSGSGALWNDEELTEEKIAGVRACVLDSRTVGDSHFVTHLVAAVIATFDHPVWGGHGPALRHALETRHA